MRSSQILLNVQSLLGEQKRLNNVLQRSFRVEVTMQHMIAIDLFLLKRNGLKSWGGGGRGLWYVPGNDVTHESYLLEKCWSALIYRKSRDLECTKIDILQFTPESITDKICPSCILLFNVIPLVIIQDMVVS